jgi:GNAT superfamily N-acetyltransferase
MELRDRRGRDTELGQRHYPRINNVTHLDTTTANPGPPSTSDAGERARIPHGALRLVRATSANAEKTEAWSAAEGWHHGHRDAAVFGRAGSGGYFAGFLGERHVSAISIVNYSDDFAFCGGLLVDPEVRRRGIAWAASESTIEYAGSRTLAADVVSELTKQAEKQGFDFDFRIFRIFRIAGRIPTPHPTDPQVNPLDAELHGEQIAAIDAACFPVDRPRFAVDFGTATGHHAVVYADVSGTVRGYAVRGMARTGPLYAERSHQAATIFDRLCDLAAQAGAVKVSMDVPTRSQAVRAIAEARGLSNIGHAYRMVRSGTVDVQQVDLGQLCAGLG